MSEVREAGSVITSENLAEFNAQRLGLATEEPADLADDAPQDAEAELVDDGESESELQAQEEATKVTEDKKQSKLEKRFSELTKQRELARQEVERERQRASELESRLRSLEAQVSPKKAESVVGDEPQASQFQDAFEYAKALAEWSAEKALSERDRAEQERKVAEERHKVVQTFNERQEALKAEVPDYEDMVATLDIVVPDPIRDAILTSEVGPKILYNLAENRDVAEKLAKMPVIQALREIGKMEARFEKNEEPVSTKTVAKPKAPPPINPLKASSTVGDVKVDNNGVYHGTYAQWKADRKAGKIR